MVAFLFKFQGGYRMRELKVYNTLTRKKETFVPVTPGQVKMYVCGITPYNHSHMGNARPFVTWDVIKRYLGTLGYEVTHIQNFTDVETRSSTLPTVKASRGIPFPTAISHRTSTSWTNSTSAGPTNIPAYRNTWMKSSTWSRPSSTKAMLRHRPRRLLQRRKICRLR